MSQPSQYKLLRQGRFGPFFVTQFLGAFNDSFLKQALLVLIVFNIGSPDANRTGILTNLAAFLFIIPFFLFSATAGHLADRFDKAIFIRWIKLSEVIIVTLAMTGFLMGNMLMLLIVLFLMGSQSAMFGPVKYSILPDYLDQHELTGGNGLVNGGTFIAILLGTVAGGFPGAGLSHVSTTGFVLIAVALAGFACSFAIPSTGSGDRDLPVRPRLWAQTKSVFACATQNRTILLTILGVSWFWFFGFLFITQLPALTRFYIFGNQQVVNVLLVVISLGIGCGSLLCETFSRHRIEIGLVPLGALGMTIFAIALYASLPGHIVSRPLVDAAGFIADPDYWPLLLSLFLLGLSAGIYVVPLLAQVQQLSAPGERSRILSANSLINAIFMSAASLMAILVLMTTSLNVAQMLLAVALLNAFVTLYIFTQVPEFLLRFFVWGLINIVFRVRIIGQDQLPQNGPAVLVCNHVSYVDALVLMGCVDRPIRFVMHYRIYQNPVLRFFFQIARAIPVAGKKEDKAMLDIAFDTVRRELEAGHLVCIFPEGGLCHDGEMTRFRPGVEKIIATTAVPVVPLAVSGLWDSSFSRQSGNWGYRLRTAFRRRVTLQIGTPVPPGETSAADLEQRVKKMRGANR